MARPRVGVDIDGVLANFTSAFKQEAEQVLDRKLEGQPADWEMSNWMTEAEQTKVWNRIKASEDWFSLYVGPLPGVIRSITHLDKFADPYFISTRIQTAGKPIKVQSQVWLNELGIEFPTVIITKDKGIVAKALKLEAFVDDKPENLEDIAKESPTTKLFLLEASYNRSYKEPKGWTRVPTFEAFVDKVI